MNTKDIYYCKVGQNGSEADQIDQMNLKWNEMDRSGPELNAPKVDRNGLKRTKWTEMLDVAH